MELAGEAAGVAAAPPPRRCLMTMSAETAGFGCENKRAPRPAARARPSGALLGRPGLVRLSRP
eukprot:4462298-Pyramimonas_sp.AAC.1